ncbi:MAG: Ribonucleoside-diphosphate reductase, adenosylcobalamin-dependent, partial [Candidatus Yanofskybacteria bacterium GW2011_GWC2_41_9]
MRFDPAGFTNNPQIPTAKSIVDYVFRYLGFKLLSQEEREEIFGVQTEHGGGLNTEIAESQSSNDKILAELISVSTGKIDNKVAVIHADAPACS